MNILANPIESAFLCKPHSFHWKLSENTEIAHVIELGIPCQSKEVTIPRTPCWVGIRIIPINLGEVLHLRGLGFESVICLKMWYSDLAVV